MNQEKIGKFIAECRKENGYTQSGLAEQLGITDRAVSKWETGKSLPDSSLMLELCDLLKINVNELLTGEHIIMENYKEIAEQNLLRLKQSEENSNKALLALEFFLIVVAMIAFTLAVCVATYTDLQEPWRTIEVLAASLLLAATIIIAFKIEQKAGYYECPECNHRYVPTFVAATFAPHIGWTKKMVCPKCGKKSWQKKVLTFN